MLVICFKCNKLFDTSIVDNYHGTIQLKRHSVYSNSTSTENELYICNECIKEFFMFEDNLYNPDYMLDSLWYEFRRSWEVGR